MIEERHSISLSLLKNNITKILIDYMEWEQMVNREVRKYEEKDSTKKEVLGKHFTKLDIFSPREIQGLMVNFAKILSSEESYIEIKIKNKKGEEIFLECSGSLMKRDDKLSGVLVVARDITERKKTEEKLKQKEELFNATLESTADGILVMDENGKVIYTNTRFFDMWLTSKKNIDSKDDKKLIEYVSGQLREPQAFIAKVEQLHTSTKKDLDTFKSKDGRIFECYSCPLTRNGKVAGRIWSFRDITRHKMALDELKDAHEILQTINKDLERKVKERTAEVENLLNQKDEFISQLGHDLKTPLSIILNFLPTIKEEIKNPEVKKDCKITISNANYIKKLVIETLKIAELSSPNVNLDINDTNLLEIVDKVIQDNQLVFEKTDINIENKIDEKIIVKADSLQIKEVFDNLITNAIKFMPEDGRLTFDTEESKDKDYVTIIVKDTGIGMEQGQVIHVFDEFYKTDESRHDLDSSGLGLSICKRIVERHGGKIWAESPGIGKGTTIYLTLKLGNMKEFGKR